MRGIDKNKWFFRLMNVGKVQLYLVRYKINNQVEYMDKTLIPSNQQQSAWYDLLLPEVNTGQELVLKMIFEDQIGRYWFSRAQNIFNGNSWKSAVYKIRRMN